MKPPFNPASITVDSLQQFRSITDPLADNVIASIIASGQEKQINQILMTLVRNDSFTKGMFASFGPEISNLLDEYIIATAKFPEWADPVRIKKGERLFELYGPNIFMLLNVSSLPMCYCCGHGAQVLFDTGRLLASPNGSVDPLARRLMETAQMIINVLSKGGLSDTGSGVVTLQKVRLIHASIRYYLTHGQSTKIWDAKTLGAPINQEDLAGTLMSFGPVILTGLKRLGVNLDDEETGAWMHCWNIVGKLLGIDDTLLPDTYAQGFQLATDILKHQAAPSDAGKALTSSCIKFMNRMIPGNAFDDVPVYLMSYFLEDFSKSSGHDLATMIGVEETPDLKDKLILAITHLVNTTISREDDRDRFVCKIIGAFNKVLLQSMIYHFNGGKGVQFVIPPSLQSNWGLVEVWKDQMSTPSILGNRLTWQKKSDIIKN